MAWKQFESGLNEFNEALGKDTGALKRLTGALELGTDDNLAHDVKEVAKRLSENQNAIASIASAQQVISHTFPPPPLSSLFSSNVLFLCRW